MNILLLLVGTASGLAHSLYSAISKSLLKTRISEPFLFLLYIGVVQALITFLFWLFIRPVFPSADAWRPLLEAGITCTIAYFFLYLSLASGDVSSVMPVMGSKVIFSSVLAGFMLDELHGWPIYTAMLLVAVSVAVLSYSPGKEASNRFSLKPVGLMLVCSIVFGFTDIYIKRSLAFLDPYNFMVYYNLIIGILSLLIIPFLRQQKVPLSIKGKDLGFILLAAVFLMGATLLFTITFQIANGIVIPNILMSTRGIFIVLISALLTWRGSSLLDMQSKKVYGLRLIAAVLIIISIWIALKK